MNPSVRKKPRNMVVQALMALVCVVVAFVAALVLCNLIPGTGVRYLTPFGELIIGSVIALTSIGLWRLAHVRAATLFLTSAFVAGFVVVVLFFFGGGISLLSTRFAYAHWGMVSDLLFVWRHTVAPVACAASISLMMEILHAKHSVISNC